MNVANLYTSKAFYDTTSALSANPFVNPRTCGVAGTLRGSCLAAFPGGNIGYANRIEGVDGIIDTITEGAKSVGQNIIGFIAPTVGAAVETLLGKAMKSTREAVGYKFLEVVQVNRNGVLTAGTKAQKPDGLFVIVFADGTEIPFTSDVARQTQAINPSTGLPVAAAAGLAVGAVALVALFFFMSKRR